MLIKPFGLCYKCSERNNCIVVTETNAKILECPDFHRSDLRAVQSQTSNLTKKK